jgi:hypothetical protein
MRAKVADGRESELASGLEAPVYWYNVYTIRNGVELSSFRRLVVASRTG